MPTRCVIYLRFSSELQRHESLASQERLCRDHAERKGYIVVGVYQDEARTGTDDKRDQFQQMIDGLLAGQIEADLILCWKFERMWRDTDMPGYYRYQLRRVGVRVESVSLQLDKSNPMNVWMQGIDQAQAAHFSVNLAIETTRGQVQNAISCQSSGGRPALGYRLVPADPADPRAKPTVYEIDERGAAAVRKIFAAVAAGRRVPELVKELNAEGYRTARGKPFLISSIHELLHNEKYIGVYEYRAWRAGNARKRSTGHMYEAEEQVIRVEGGIPAIVDKATWDAVQARLQARKHSGRRYSSPVVYLLSGRASCGLCGSPMHGNRQTYRNAAGKVVEYFYYACARQPVGCAARRIRKDWLEAEVIAALEEHLFTEAGQAAMVQAVLAWRDDYAARRDSETAGLQSRLDQAARELERLIDGIAAGVPVTPALCARMQTLEAERAAITAQQQALPTAPALVTEESIRALLATLRAQLHPNPADPAHNRARQSILSDLLDSVVIHPDRIDITLSLTPPNQNGGEIIPRRPARIVGARDWNKNNPAGRMMISIRREMVRGRSGPKKII